MSPRAGDAPRLSSTMATGRRILGFVALAFGPPSAYAQSYWQQADTARWRIHFVAPEVSR